MAVNNASVNAEEALRASRHGSVAAQRAYMAVDQVSEANRMMALGFKTKKRKMTTEAKKKEDDAKEGTEEPEAKLAKL